MECRLLAKDRGRPRRRTKAGTDDSVTTGHRKGLANSANPFLYGRYDSADIQRVDHILLETVVIPETDADAVYPPGEEDVVDVQDEEGELE